MELTCSFRLTPGKMGSGEVGGLFSRGGAPCYFKSALQAGRCEGSRKGLYAVKNKLAGVNDGFLASA